MAFENWQLPSTKTYDPTGIQWSENNTYFSFLDDTGATKYAVPVGFGMADQEAWKAAGGTSPFLTPYGDFDAVGGWGPSNYQGGQRTNNPIYGQFSGNVPGLENLNLRGNPLAGYQILDTAPGETFTTYESLKPKGDWSEWVIPALGGAILTGGLSGALGNALTGTQGTGIFGGSGFGDFFGNSGFGSSGSDVAGGIGGGGSDAIGGGMETGAFDMYGMGNYPGGAVSSGMGPGSIFANVPNQSALQGLLSQIGITDPGAAGTLAKLLPSILGGLGSMSQTDALKDLAAQQGQNSAQLQAMGAPYRNALAKLYANPAAFLSSPEVTTSVDQGTQAMARALSAQFGNPVGSGTALQELQNYAANQLFGKLGQEKDRLAGFGGLTAYNNAGANSFGNMQIPLAAANSESNLWNAIGSGLNTVLNPQPTLVDLLRELRGGLSLA